MSVLDKLELTSRESITRPKQGKDIFRAFLRKKSKQASLFIESKQASELWSVTFISEYYWKCLWLQRVKQKFSSRNNFS